LIKKIFSLVVATSVTSVICAGLLYLGITVMGNYSPVLAYSPNALVVGTNAQIPSDANGTAGGVPATMNPGGEKAELEVSSIPTAVSPSPISTSQPTKVVPGQLAPEATPATGITIAQLLKSPNQYFDRIFILTGIATRLGSDKFLLNDGTGQIMVDVEDDLVSFAVVSGMSITVMGKLDDTSSQSGVELDAYKLTNQNGTAVSTNCMDDDCLDDSNDGNVDDSQDDMDDDSDCDTDVDSDDDNADDSEDDSGDDSEDDGEDD
jgi:uncharacterized protein YdeI (BOF family)